MIFPFNLPQRTVVQKHPAACGAAFLCLLRNRRRGVFMRSHHFGYNRKPHKGKCNPNPNNQRDSDHVFPATAAEHLLHMFPPSVYPADGVINPHCAAGGSHSNDGPDNNPHQKYQQLITLHHGRIASLPDLRRLGQFLHSCNPGQHRQQETQHHTGYI